jgi:hypothetical protein
VSDTIKLAEAMFSLVTQHVHMATVNKAIGQRGADMVLDNITMKTNKKLGGLCHSLATPSALLRENRLSNDYVYVSYPDFDDDLVFSGNARSSAENVSSSASP